MAEARAKSSLIASISSSLIVGEVPEDTASQKEETVTEAETEAFGDKEPATASMKVMKYLTSMDRETEASNRAADGSEQSEKEEVGESNDEDDPNYSPSQSGSPETGAGSEPNDATGDNSSGPSEAFIGLRIYTQGGELVEIVGTVKEEADRLYALNTLSNAT